jgi:hypothetical protein
MGNAAGHLAKDAQTFLLHYPLLRLAQIVVRLLQRGAEFHLMRGQRDMFAQLPQKFAFSAAKAVMFSASGDKHPENLVFNAQRRRH